MPQPRGVHAEYYAGCLDKLSTWLLPYDRVVYLDADVLVVRPPMHLLEMPPRETLAAGQAYWSSPGGTWLTSALMSLKVRGLV
jgi:alpha-N-acetylglucosamine transferase